jgi:uncharacterized protein YqeY
MNLIEKSTLLIFLVKAPTEEEINNIINQAIKDSEASSIKEMGKVMALIKPQVQGKADLGKISATIKSLLAK